MINITGVDLVKFVKKVYSLSVPQGFGFLHYQNDELSNEEAEELIHLEHSWGPVNMDYIKGRACKMRVIKKDNKLLIPTTWYDHTNAQYQELLNHVGVKAILSEDHSIACNCAECQYKNRG